MRDMRQDDKKGPLRFAPLLCVGLVTLLLTYVGAYFAITRLEFVTDGPPGVQVVRHFPSRGSFVVFTPLWRLEMRMFSGRDAGYLVD